VCVYVCAQFACNVSKLTFYSFQGHYFASSCHCNELLKKPHFSILFYHITTATTTATTTALTSLLFRKLSVRPGPWKKKV